MGIFTKKQKQPIGNINEAIVNANYLVNLANDINVMKANINAKAQEIFNLTEANKKLVQENQQLKDKFDAVKKILGETK